MEQGPRISPFACQSACDAAGAFAKLSAPWPSSVNLAAAGGHLGEQQSFVIGTEAPASLGCNAHPAVVAPPHPSQAAAMPSLSAFDSGPLVVTNDPRATGQVVETDMLGHVPINEAFALESESFVGRMINQIRGHPGADEAAFGGGRMLGRTIIQGCFKQRTPAKDVWVGQELLNRPLVPSSLQRLIFTSAAKFFGSSYRVTVEGEGEAMGYMNPLLALSEVVHVAPPGSPPCDLADVREDVRLLDARLVDAAGRPLPSRARRRHFDRPEVLADPAIAFEPGLVYTFVVSQAIVDLVSYRLKLGGMLNMDLASVLNGQPLGYLCKNVATNENILSLLVWHKHLNYAPNAGSSSSSSSNSNSSISPAEWGGGMLGHSSSIGSQLNGLTTSNSYACLVDAGSLRLFATSSCSAPSSSSSSSSSADLRGMDSSSSSSSGNLSSLCAGSVGDAEDWDADADDAVSEYGSCSSSFGDAPGFQQERMRDVLQDALAAGCDCGAAPLSDSDVSSECGGSSSGSSSIGAPHAADAAVRVLAAGSKQRAAAGPPGRRRGARRASHLARQLLARCKAALARSGRA